MLESAAAATDLDLNSCFQAIPDARMWRGVRIPAWYLLVVAVLGILSGCQSLEDLERFAIHLSGIVEQLVPDRHLMSRAGVVVALEPVQAAIVTGGKHPNDLPQFRWINTLLGNLKTSLSGMFHAFNFDNYARRYLGGYCFRCNRRFSLAAMTERIATAVCCCMPCTERDLRVAEAFG